MSHKKTMRIDLNCDMGEGVGNEAAIMPHITSANIACGFHAGDAVTMRETVRLAKRFGVAVGAHPSWPDREGFGRREITLPLQEVEALVREQVQALAAMARAEGVALRHVKPHGALYNQAAKDRELANAIARTVKAIGEDLVLVGLAGSGLVEAGRAVGLRVAPEGFADRRYNPDGTLVSRREPHAMIESPEEAAAQALELVERGIPWSGQRVRVETLCLHGDHPHAVDNARQVREALVKAGVEVRAL